MGETFRTAAARGVTLEPNLVAEVTMWVASAGRAANMAAAIFSAKSGEDDFAVMRLVTCLGQEVKVGGESLFTTVRTVMGPLCNFDAAVIAERVAGGRLVAEGDSGSETTNVEANRLLMLEITKTLRVLSVATNRAADIILLYRLQFGSSQ